MAHGPSLDKLCKAITNVTKNDETKEEVVQSIAVALNKDRLNPALKTYVDLSRRFKLGEYKAVVEEWEKSQQETHWARKGRQGWTNSMTRTLNAPYSQKTLKCYSCGKLGHLMRKYRSKPAGERPALTEQPVASNTIPAKSDAKNITCFRCHQKRHKSPSCLSRPKGNRRVKIPSDKLLYLQHKELLGKVGKHSMPITCDSGAQVSVAPEESVEENELTGETQVLEDFHTGRVTGNVCNIVFTIAGRPFNKKAVTLPGESLRWTPCMAVPLAPREEMDFILKQMEIKQASDKKETRYLPPVLGDLLISGLMVSEGVVVPPLSMKGVQKTVVEKVRDAISEIVPYEVVTSE